MDVDRLQEALKDFEKRGKKDISPELDQFLSHVAKTGETVVQWTQFKEYFIFKLEKVMDDFRSSAPEQRGPPNPNVEYIPFDEMKERILKIVIGFNGTPFTIQRLCELLMDPRRNYTGTDKFLRGVEKNVMVVSCVYPSSEKNPSTSVNRMNGVMFPSNSQSYTDRSNVNGPGTPRPVNRPKVSLSSPMTTNGLPDSTENKDPDLQQKDDSSDCLTSDDGSPTSTVKNKHSAEDLAEAEEHEVKRLKFDTEDEEEEEAACANPETSNEVSSEMAEEAESASSADTEKESCHAEPSAAEESLMTPSESTATICKEKEISENVCVSEESSEDSHQMEESDQSETASVAHNDEQSPSNDVGSNSSEAELQATFGSKSPEIPAESPMDNSEEATDAPEEPMEQD